MVSSMTFTTDSIREILKSFAALVEALSLKRSSKLKFCLEDVSEARTRWAAQSGKGSWAKMEKVKMRLRCTISA